MSLNYSVFQILFFYSYPPHTIYMVLKTELLNKLEREWVQGLKVRPKVKLG